MAVGKMVAGRALQEIFKKFTGRYNVEAGREGDPWGQQETSVIVDADHVLQGLEIQDRRRVRRPRRVVWWFCQEGGCKSITDILASR